MKHGQEKRAIKVFLDANVIPDLYLKREGYESTKQIMSLVINGKCQAYVNPYEPEEFLQNVTIPT